MRSAHLDPGACFTLIDPEAIHVVAVWKARSCVIILPVIACSVYDQDVVFHCETHGVIHNLLVFCESLAEAHVDDLGAVFNRVADRVGNILVALIPIRDGTKHHDPYIVGDALDAYVVVPDSADDTRNVGAVVSIRSGNVSIAVETFAAVLIIVANDMAWIEFLIKVIIDLIVEMLYAVLKVFIKFAEVRFIL